MHIITGRNNERFFKKIDSRKTNNYVDWKV